MTNRLLTLGLLVGLLGVDPPYASANDLRDGVPKDVYLATYHRHNPERDYQQVYFDRIWQTIEETQICPRLLEAIENQFDESQRENLDQVRETLAEALEPVQWEALAECTESVYAQRMTMPTSQHLVLLRLPEGAAESFVAGVTNLIKLAEDASKGEVSLVNETVSGVELTTMQVPEKVPYSVTVGAVGDVFVLSTRRDFARQSVELLKNPAADSKFNDPRLAEALEHLPQFEDGLTFFDGRQLFTQLREISTFIRQVGGGDADAERASKLISTVINELDGFDYEVTVEYTEGYQNRSAAFGRVMPDIGEKVIGRMFIDQQPFEDWSRWVPAGASSYSLTSGVNLHPLYAWLMEVIPSQFPEAQPGLDRFAELQDQFDLHLDEDLFQAFSGESVSVGISGQSVSFLRRDKPDRIRALLHRLIETLQGIPQLQAQNISLVDVEGLDGFEEISAGVFAMAGIRPVVGFDDGWLVCGSHADVVQTVLETRAGEGETIIDTEAFQEFALDVRGPVVSIGYTNVAEQTRAIAQGIQQVGFMLPMITGMAAQQGADIDLSAASEFFALLPSVGQIIGTLDFYEEKLSVTQPGPDELSYTRQTVVLVRPPTVDAE